MTLTPSNQSRLNDIDFQFLIVFILPSDYRLLKVPCKPRAITMTGGVYTDPGLPEICSDNKQLTHYQDEIDVTSFWVSPGSALLSPALHHHIQSVGERKRETENENVYVCTACVMLCVCMLPCLYIYSTSQKIGHTFPSN